MEFSGSRLTEFNQKINGTWTVFTLANYLAFKFHEHLDLYK